MKPAVGQDDETRPASAAEVLDAYLLQMIRELAMIAERTGRTALARSLRASARELLKERLN